MATPTEGYPNWATNEVIENIDGKTYTNRIPIPPEVKNSGLKYQEPLARAWLNQNFNVIRKWIEEFDLRTAGGSVQTGWIHYLDTQYTEGSPFTITAGNTVAIPNNAGTIINDGAPTNGDTFWDGSEITANNEGDAYTISIRMRASGSVNDAALACRIDIGNGSPTLIIGDSRRLVRGAGTYQFVTFDFSLYTLATFVANGGVPKLEAIDGDISIADIGFFIHRTYYKDNT